MKMCFHHTIITMMVLAIRSLTCLNCAEQKDNVEQQFQILAICNLDFRSPTICSIIREVSKYCYTD